MEYALDGDAVIVGDSEPTVTKNGNVFQYTFTKRNDDPNLVYTVQLATDLESASWGSPGA